MNQAPTCRGSCYVGDREQNFSCFCGLCGVRQDFRGNCDSCKAKIEAQRAKDEYERRMRELQLQEREIAAAKKVKEQELAPVHRKY